MRFSFIRLGSVWESYLSPVHGAEELGECKGKKQLVAYLSDKLIKYLIKACCIGNANIHVFRATVNQ